MRAQYETEQKNATSWIEDEEDPEDENGGIRLSKEQEEELNHQLDVIFVQKQIQKEKRRKTAIICGIAAAVVLASGLVFFVGESGDADEEEWNSSNNNVDGDPFVLEGNNTFELDGETYTMPSKASSFTENGWQIVFNDSDDEVDTLSDYDSAYIAFSKNGKEFYASLTSLSGDTVTLEDADVTHIYVDDYRTPAFSGPLGLQMGMAKADAEKIIEDSQYAYRIYESEYSESYYFETEMNDDYDYSFDVYLYDDEVASIALYYYTW